LFNLLWRYGGYDFSSNYHLEYDLEVKENKPTKTPRVGRIMRFYCQWPSVRLLWLSVRKPNSGNLISMLTLDLVKIIQHYVTGENLWQRKTIPSAFEGIAIAKKN
jgi:hypothetical protein